jgi:hypothetical protein
MRVAGRPVRAGSDHASGGVRCAAAPGRFAAMESGGLLTIAYVIVGAFVAAANHYFAHVGTIKGVVSAIIAILAWPLILIGIDIRWT